MCCLLAGLDLWKKMLLQCSITMVFTYPLLSWCKISSLFKENNNMLVFPFTFYIFMPLANLCFIRLQGEFPILKTRSCPDICTLIRPPKRQLARENPYSEIHSVFSYVNRLRRWLPSYAKRCRLGFFLHWW